MSPSQQRFFDLLARAPRIRNLWNRDRRELDVDAFEAALGVLSHGEAHLARFFAAVWFNDNSRYGFDLVDAVASLDAKGRGLVMDWLREPFWP